ncbi:MBL fold metallo-hydrolase [Cerasibacillus sp. JNUCC 74]
MKIHTIGYWGAYPKANKATSCYLIEDSNTKILLDCGSGALSKLQARANLEDLDAVFISHTHTDHMADIYSLEYAMLILTQLGKRTKPLDVYVYTEDIASLTFEFPDVMRVHQLQLTDTVNIGSLMLTFSENIHEIPCCSMKVSNNKSKLVYSGDTGYTTALVDFAMAADLLLIECSFYRKQKGMMKGHLSSEEVADIATKAKAKHVVLTHFPHFGDILQLKQEVESVLGQPVYLAKEGFTFTI